MGTIKIKPAQTNLNEEEVLLLSYYLEYIAMHVKTTGSLTGKVTTKVKKDS